MTAYYPSFETVRINASAQRVLVTSATLNVSNITAGGTSLGTKSSDANGKVVQSSFAVAAGTVVEFSHATYGLKVRFTLQATQDGAYTAFENPCAYLLEDLSSSVPASLAKLYLTDGSAAPVEVGAGVSGDTVYIPYAQSSVSKSLTLTPLSLSKNKFGQASRSLDPAYAVSVAIPASGAITALASENINASAPFVDLFLSGGVIKARRGNATDNTKPARGYVLASVTSGNTATVYVQPGTVVSGLSGLTIGSDYFLDSTTPGSFTTSVLTLSSGLVQRLGRALTTTTLLYLPGPSITRS